ncbi:MAG: hypothetical protein ACYC09_07795 [Bacteroidota bacterium]
MNVNYKKSQFILGNQVEFLRFMRTRAPLFHLSNLFLRDLHYAVMEFLKSKKVTVRHTEAEQIAREIALQFEKKNIVKKLNANTWMLMYSEFSLKKST